MALAGLAEAAGRGFAALGLADGLEAPFGLEALGRAGLAWDGLGLAGFGRGFPARGFAFLAPLPRVGIKGPPTPRSRRRRRGPARRRRSRGSSRAGARSGRGGSRAR